MRALDCLSLYEDAEFYDLEFSTREMEIPFFRKHAKRAGGPVLEVACGTGRITLPIARDGVEIVGLDVSHPMIERARRKSAGEDLRVTWVEQDCRNMHFDRCFALVFSATNAMQHLLDLESVRAFLRAAGRALAPGGRLILDVFNPDLAKLARTSGSRYVHKNITSARHYTSPRRAAIDRRLCRNRAKIRCPERGIVSAVAPFLRLWKSPVCNRRSLRGRFLDMKPDDLLLPPGTAVKISESGLDLSLDWWGLSGRHIIHFQQTLDWQDREGREDAVAGAVALFRNVVGFEVIDDAMSAGQWPPPAIDDEAEGPIGPPGEWRRSREER